MSLKSSVEVYFSSLWARAGAEERKTIAAIVAAEHGLVQRSPWWLLALDAIGLLLIGIAIGHWLV